MLRVAADGDLGRPLWRKMRNVPATESAQRAVRGGDDIAAGEQAPVEDV
jgi:hypothetical protein